MYAVFYPIAHQTATADASSTKISLRISSNCTIAKYRKFMGRETKWSIATDEYAQLIDRRSRYPTRE
jgi:hypothetical protein